MQQTNKAWDSARGQAIWQGKTDTEQQQLLADHDALLWAALGIAVTPDSAHQTKSNWRPIKAAPLKSKPLEEE